ncbi:sorbosone dehydrogenase family protein [Sphingomonas sp.]|uniref:PQQ-dependent sugar dehydrogenase n=1 Tax=Sphingomonas sp. TaxID=28214 RepID=UPI0025E24C9A|nr:sorbosone dehydrogenase family protein [Sphingomonas sp.]
MTIRRRILIIIVVLIAIIAGVIFYLTRGDTAQLSADAVSGTRPRITSPRVQQFPTIDVADVVGWQGAAKPVAAAGLSVNAFAADLDHPRWLYQLPNGDVLVAETNSPKRPTGGISDFVMKTLMSKVGAGGPSANRITLLRDTDGDGVADFRSVFLTGLESPFGMALVGDRLFVGNHNALVAFPYKPGDTRITAPAQKIVALPGGGNHWAKNVVADPTGNLLYIGVGSSTNIADNGMDAEKNRANILEYNLQTHKIRIYAAGLRNPVGMAWEPKSQQLWTVVNERDMLGSDLAPDYLTLVELGAFYGWPYSYWGGYEDPRVEARPELLQYTRRPDYALGPHTASLGLAFGSLGTFTDGAFIGQHGSWNRKPVSGYKVTFVPFGPRGFPQGKMQDVLTGFLDKDGKAQGRPVGVIVDKAGSLLVADDVGNRIWRVSLGR